MILRFDHANVLFHMVAKIFGTNRKPFAVIVIINSFITSHHTCDYLNKEGWIF